MKNWRQWPWRRWLIWYALYAVLWLGFEVLMRLSDEQPLQASMLAPALWKALLFMVIFEWFSTGPTKKQHSDPSDSAIDEHPQHHSTTA